MRESVFTILRIFGFISICIFLICCSRLKQENNLAQKKKLDFADSLWIDFSTAIENKDFAYLVENSLDTIECIDCTNDSAIEKPYFKSDFIFQNHLESLYNHEYLEKLQYTTFHSDTNEIRINYSIESPQAPEGGYNIIYTFIRKNNKYLFKGMITVP